MNLDIGLGVTESTEKVGGEDKGKVVLCA